MGALTIGVRMDISIIKALSGRTIAYIILKISGAFVGGSAIGLEFWQSAVMAAFTGIMEIAEEMSRNYLNDGQITVEEMDASFAKLQESQDETK
jgi:hypothetical protein